MGGPPFRGVSKADRTFPLEDTPVGVPNLLAAVESRKTGDLEVLARPCAGLVCVVLGGRPTLTGMARGPAPTPKHILALRGSEEANYREELGTPLREMPQPPDYIKPLAQQMFRQVCEYTQNMGTLAESDVEVIARYAAVWERWRTAEEQLKGMDSGYVEVLAPDGSLRFSRPNKWMTQANVSHEQLRQLETVLGLTPADRTRLGYHAEKVVLDPMDELLKKRG